MHINETVTAALQAFRAVEAKYAAAEAAHSALVRSGKGGLSASRDALDELEMEVSEAKDVLDDALFEANGRKPWQGRYPDCA